MPSNAHPTRVVIVGAGGRDFHVFLTRFRDDPGSRVVAFTAAQIPGIDHRTFPASLAGPRYPEGIPVLPEADLEDLVRRERVDEVVLAYSDLAHTAVMHLASRALAAGADVRLAGERATALPSTKPVVAVCATRTGAGKSQTSRAVARLLAGAGLRVAFVRHPMPYGDLEAMRVQRFATLADLDAAAPTIEEREEYELPIAEGFTVWAGVDYRAILDAACAEADVILWDGGNNDTSFFAADVQITVADALRPGHELAYHPGEVNLRLADVVVVNKVDDAHRAGAETIVRTVREVRGDLPVVLAASDVTLEGAPNLTGRRVLVVEDGPSLTHGGLPEGAGTVAARAAGAIIADPRPHAVGTLRETFDRFPHLGPVLPAMGYSPAELADLAASIAATPCDAVVTGTPIDLGRLLPVGVPVHRARYELRELGHPTLADVLAPWVASWQEA